MEPSKTGQGKLNGGAVPSNLLNFFYKFVQNSNKFVQNLNKIVQNSNKNAQGICNLWKCVQIQKKSTRTKCPPNLMDINDYFQSLLKN